MKFTVKSGNPEQQQAGCIVVGVFTLNGMTKTAKAIDVASNGYLAKILSNGDIQGNIGQSLLLHNVPGILPTRVLLVGLGNEKDLHSGHYLKVLTHSINQLRSTSAKDAIVCLIEPDVTVTSADKAMRDDYWKVRHCVEISQHATYKFKYKASRSKPSLSKLMLVFPTGHKGLALIKRAINHGTAIANGISLTRNLADLPPNICTPSYLATQAKQLGKAHNSVKVTVLNEAAMSKLGMECLLSVSQGSWQPAKLIRMEYKGGKKMQRPVVLVGKGVTFDTGGISIKPSAAMDEMKYDMCGAASVLGTISAVAEMALPLNVIGIVPTVENMPGGKATRPGDIYTSMSGQTVEILNTDAEGRLILCDALTYSERFNPIAVIDIATLTGACVVALGKHASGLLSNHDSLAKAILDASEYTADRAWQLPLWEEYQSQIDSPFADMANIGGRDAGTITAACFLSRFTKRLHWAHLDIAGTAWLSGKNKGATGRPVPLLTQYLLNQCGK